MMANSLLFSFLFTIIVSCQGGYLKDTIKQFTGRNAPSATTDIPDFKPIAGRNTQNYLKDTADEPKKSSLISTTSSPQLVTMRITEKLFAIEDGVVIMSELKDGGFAFNQGGYTCILSSEQKGNELTCNGVLCKLHKAGIWKCDGKYTCNIQVPKKKAGCFQDQRAILNAPDRGCPSGQKMAAGGKCRSEW